LIFICALFPPYRYFVQWAQNPETRAAFTADDWYQWGNFEKLSGRLRQIRGYVWRRPADAIG